jgi:hypothetical protein
VDQHQLIALMPPVNEPVTSIIGYHIRSGGHDITSYDWQRFIDFANEHLQPDGFWCRVANRAKPRSELTPRG